MDKKEYAPLTLDSTMPFGKHKGKTIGSLINEERDYVTWLLGTDIVLGDDVQEAMLDTE